MMNSPLLRKELERDEGVIRKVYTDSQGHLTCGIGFNLDVHPLPPGITFPLSDEEIDTLFNITINDVEKGLDTYLSWWRDLDEVRQRVLMNMTFNLGIHGLLAFKNTLAAIKDGEYALAADNMKKSLWYSQVGQRAIRLCEAIRTGVMPK